MATDDELIERARRRVAMGSDDAIDHHRLRAAERRERVIRKDMHATDTVFVTNDDALVEDQTVREGYIYQDLADALTVMGDGLRNQFRAENETITKNLAAMIHDFLQRQSEENNRLRALENELAELRGQVKALTAERSRIWRPGDAT
jgi:hypothetical protein